MFCQDTKEGGRGFILKPHEKTQKNLQNTASKFEQHAGKCPASGARLGLGPSSTAFSVVRWGATSLCILCASLSALVKCGDDKKLPFRVVVEGDHTNKDLEQCLAHYKDSVSVVVVINVVIKAEESIAQRA